MASASDSPLRERDSDSSDVSGRPRSESTMGPAQSMLSKLSLTEEDPPEAPVLPTTSSITTVRDILCSPLLRTPLPLELADIILDYAEYWACSSLTVSYPIVAYGSGPPDSENVLCLRTLPLGLRGTEGEDRELMDRTENLAWKIGGKFDAASAMPRGEHPCRRIVFEIRSHDQGWGGDVPPDAGPFDGAYTWFDAGVERLSPSALLNPDGVRWEQRYFTDAIHHLPSHPFDACADGANHPFLPPPRHVQRNRRAHLNSQDHVVVWDWQEISDEAAALAAADAGRGKDSIDGEFVRNLRVGDCVTLWARARFAGWANHVEKATVKVYWAVK